MIIFHFKEFLIMRTHGHISTSLTSKTHNTFVSVISNHSINAYPHGNKV